eukprot:m.248223 g.248223  ORF g.248223 m.248223 type:complete len:73 (+) comp15411_c0_seq1:2543-2761(+)
MSGDAGSSLLLRNCVATPKFGKTLNRQRCDWLAVNAHRTLRYACGVCSEVSVTFQEYALCTHPHTIKLQMTR